MLGNLASEDKDRCEAVVKKKKMPGSAPSSTKLDRRLSPSVASLVSLVPRLFYSTVFCFCFLVFVLLMLKLLKLLSLPSSAVGSRFRRSLV